MQTSRSTELPDSDSTSDWRWQTRNAIRDLVSLEAHLELTDQEREGVRRALRDGFPMAITPYYLSLCDPHDPQCPIRKQCIPHADESKTVPGDLRDPLGEEVNEVAPHLIRRYPDRALLLITDRCALYCRFCTRSRMVGNGGGARSLDALAPAFEWLASHPEIQDVIVSGGDPFIMNTERIAAVLSRLARIDHILYVRVATRAPVTIPQRVTSELCHALRTSHPAVWIMTHFNHPKELTEAAHTACSRLVDSGLPVMNQTVLLRGINDEPSVLESLFRGLVRWRVRPYYLLQADPVRGTAHLRTPLNRGIEIMEHLQGRMSGIAVPKFIVDTPHGRGKVALLPDNIIHKGEGTTSLRTFRGEIVDYIDPTNVTSSESR